MPPDFLHNHRQFGDLIRIVGANEKIEPALVAKDYWIMQSLCACSSWASPSS